MSCITCSIFTKLAHHKKVSCIVVLQNLFYKSPEIITINRNAQYVILFKNPRDELAVSTFARQTFPGKHTFVMQAFRNATKDPYGYLLFDFKPYTPSYLRIRTNVLSQSKEIAYVESSTQIA